MTSSTQAVRRRALVRIGLVVAVGAAAFTSSTVTSASARAGARLREVANGPTQQWTPLERGSDNIEVVAHLPLGPRLSVADLDIEQELSRPYAYVGRIGLFEGEKGMDIIDLHEPASPRVIYRWRIENQDLHLAPGGMDVKNFKWQGRYYVVQSLQFREGGPDVDLGAVVLDVTGLPDAAKVKEVGRIRAPEYPGGFHNIFVYKHSNGRVLLFTTVRGPYAYVYDLGYLVEGKGGEHGEEALVAKVPVASSQSTGPLRGYHDMYAGFHADSETDRFYGGGTGGYYVYDITDLENPQLLVSLTGISGVAWGHTFTPSPDGRYAVAETEYQYAPLRIFDLKPALDGEVKNIRRPISAWTADWRHLVHNHEVRWPYVFVSGYVDGLQVFSLMDPKNPVTVAYYDTYIGPMNTDFTPVFNGAFGVDVRNADGLIVVSDSTSGFWAFRIEGFNGWNGADWGMPNISSAQDWDHGPAGSADSREGGR
ncbi:MAG: LVIVD repeat-containing protein [Acidobacteriota bacterium]